jgi:hypothetical protein
MRGLSIKRLFHYQTIIIFVLLIVVTGVFGCQTSESKADRAKAIIQDKVIIILVKEPDLNSSVIDVQDYIRDGKSYVPFFSSHDAFNESISGTKQDQPVYQIDRRLFVQMINPQNNLVLNPGLRSEMIFTGAELKVIFPEPFPGLTNQSEQ